MPGQNDWFKINLDRELDNSKIKFAVTFDLPNNVELDFERASDLTAQAIADSYPNLHLGLSGGLDSEYVAKVFLRNHIRFVPVILIMNTFDPNEHWYAQYFCEQYDLKPIIIDYSDRLYDLQKLMIQESVKIRCECNLAFAHHVIAHELPDAQLCTGVGHPLQRCMTAYDQPHGEQLVIDEYDFYLDVTYRNKHPGGFFSYTPDSFLSLIKNIDLSVNSQKAKSKLFQIPFRPKLNLAFRSYVPKQHVWQDMMDKFAKPQHMRQVCLTKQELLSYDF